MTRATTALSAGAATFPGMRRRAWRFSPWLVPLPGFVLLAVLSLPPFLYALYLAFVDVDVSLPERPVHFVGIANFAQVLTTPTGLNALWITLLVSFSATALTVLVGLVTAYLIDAVGGRLSGLLVVLTLIPLSVSPVAMALVFSLMLDPLYGPVPQVVAMLGGPLISLTGSAVGAICTVIFVQVWQWSPLAVVLILGGLRSLPAEPREAAAIDGAGALAAFWHVSLPLLQPVVTVTAIFEFVLCSQVFAVTELLTNGGPGNATVDLSLYIYKVGIAESSQVSVAAAAGIVALILGLASTAAWLKLSRWDAEVH